MNVHHFLTARNTGYHILFIAFFFFSFLLSPQGVYGLLSIKTKHFLDLWTYQYTMSNTIMDIFISITIRRVNNINNYYDFLIKDFNKNETFFFSLTDTLLFFYKQSEILNNLSWAIFHTTTVNLVSHLLFSV